VVGFALVLLGRPLILLLLGDAYSSGADVLPYLVVFYLLTVSVWLFGVFASLIEKTYVSTIGLVTALPVNVALNLILIPRLGIVGAALATMLSYTLLWFVFVGICVRLGMVLRRKTLLASLIPFLLLLPAIPAAVLVGGVIVVTLSTDWIIDRGERGRIRAEIAAFIRRGRPA
jgi:O-antigen/teichoic acid export membrane protein